MDNFTGIKKEKASALMIALTVTTIVIIFGVVVSEILVTEININKDLGDSLNAIYAADTGIETKLYEIRVGELIPASVGESSTYVVNLSGYQASDQSTAVVTVFSLTAQTVGLDSVGDFRGTFRGFEVVQPLQ